MKQKLTLGVGVLAVVLLAGAYAAGQKEEPPGAAPGVGPRPVEKWEYAELHYLHVPERRARAAAAFGAAGMGAPAGRGKGGKGAGGPGGPGGPGAAGAPGGAAGPAAAGGPGAAMPAPPIILPARTTVTWVTEDATVEATGWEDMASKLKALPARKAAVEEHHKLRTLNRLGADGWEVYAHRPRESLSGADIWLMKRKVK